MYFAILGKHTLISQYELQTLLKLKEYNRDKKKNIVSFTTDQQKLFRHSAGSIKIGRVVETEELENSLEDCTLLGHADKKKAIKYKKVHKSIKRFKEVDLTHTDREVKEKGVELVTLNTEQVGIVNHYQNIKLYETIDFEKPQSGMNIGMMPAKLAHLLLNIALGKANFTGEEKITIRDPFCGFGTTNFIAHAQGFNTIGSDINIHQAKQNKKWWETLPDFYQPGLKTTFYKHDVTQKFTQPFLDYCDCIVSEGWLGPVITSRTREEALNTNVKKIVGVYKNFFSNLTSSPISFKNLKSIVITVPEYQHYEGRQPIENILAHVEELGFEAEALTETYKRKGQKVGRKILICTT